jgi:hypothetical protein
MDIQTCLALNQTVRPRGGYADQRTVLKLKLTYLPTLHTDTLKKEIWQWRFTICRIILQLDTLGLTGPMYVQSSEELSLGLHKTLNK